MHEDLAPWQTSHDFTPSSREAERRTLQVVALTAVTMVIEVTAGAAFGSMALMADGWHMGSHVAAIGASTLAFVYARRRALDPRYSFGTGKVSSLAGFASAIALGIVALLMAGESLERVLHPRAIQFDHALVVAVLGLAVNLLSAWILLRVPGGHGHAHGHGHGHGHAHGHGHDDGHAHRDGPGHHDGVADQHEHDHPLAQDHDHVTRASASAHGATAASAHGAKMAGAHGATAASAHGRRGHHHEDHNLRAAYLHVLADALTSVTAIVALLAGRVLGLGILDPLMGIVGALVISKWCFDLLRDTGGVLLDRVPDPGTAAAIRVAVEEDGDSRIADLHLWQLAPGRTAAILSVVGHTPASPAQYKARLAEIHPLVHVTVEVNTCPDTV